MTNLTSAQAEVWDLHKAGKNQREIADLIGKSRRTVRGLLERARHNISAAEDRDPGVQSAMDAFNLISDDVERVWFKNKALTVQVGTKRSKDEDLVERLVEAFQNIPPAPQIEAPSHTLTNQMVVYPLFDAHHGLRAHAEISGEDMDLEISKKRILTGLSNAVASAPAADRAIIINGGDFTHQTDDNNKTRRSSHVLDVAGRNLITVLEAIEIIAAGIEMALSKHWIVEYYSVPGNHDPQNWETILIGLRERYRNHDRVIIDETWNEFSVIEHGEVAIFIHHGDKRTPKDLAMFCAAEFSEVWGRTKYRLLFTGHLHHWKAEEFPGITWIQMPAIGARDHHAAGGYKSHSMLVTMGFDLESETFTHKLRLK